MSAFLLVRHAQSTWNATGRWQGQADPPLSETGEASSRQAGQRLRDQMRFDLVVTSDLVRAQRTGELLGGQGPAAGAGPGSAPRVVVEPSLREFHVGRWSGLTRAEIAKAWGEELDLFDAGRLAGAPGGETRADFDARVAMAARQVAGLIHRHQARLTLIVTHGGVIRSIARSCGLVERHIRNLAGYGGTAGGGELSLSYPVDLLDGEAPGEVAGPVTL
ncbi:MAG TPA: histidine phosphatase family protein [Acidimicrobiales bacterium]|nr:histidine phosphatase family protein [Acidimicrobiales bacterium]